MFPCLLTFMFFLSTLKKYTSALNFAEEIIIEKELRSIGVIVDQEDLKDPKDTSKKSQASSAKAKEIYHFDMDNLTMSLKFLTNKVSKLKRNSTEDYNNNTSFKLFLKNNSN